MTPARTFPSLLGSFLLCLAFQGESLAQKKGGESCDKDSDCQTRSCSSGKCDPCPDRNNCPPPGTCSESELSRYREEVTKWCKSEERSCGNESFNETEVDCGSLKKRFEAAENCVRARDEVMQRCFKGGDDAHRNERQNAAEVRDKCREIIRYKEGVNACYSCSPSDYSSYRDSVRSACEKTLTCDERKDDTKVSCSKIEDKLSNGRECLKKQDELASRCFNGRRNSRRELHKQQTESAVNQCKEVLDYKKDKKLCE